MDPFDRWGADEDQAVVYAVEEDWVEDLSNEPDTLTETEVAPYMMAAIRSPALGVIGNSFRVVGKRGGL